MCYTLINYNLNLFKSFSYIDGIEKNSFYYGETHRPRKGRAVAPSPEPRLFIGQDSKII